MTCACGKPSYYKSGQCTVCYRRAWMLRTQYGLTPEAYDRLLWSQGGACAICRKTQDKPLDVDHNHLTGVVRGLLCNPCNQGIGYLRSDEGSGVLEAAYSYVAMDEWIELEGAAHE